MKELGLNLNAESVCDLSLREPITVKPQAIVRSAVAQMRFKALGCAVIMDSENRPVGIFTERSLIDMLVHKASLDKHGVGQFADPNFMSVRCGDPIKRVWRAVVRRGVRQRPGHRSARSRKP